MEKEKITIGDRLSAAFIIFIASLITAIIICSIIFYTAMAANELVYFQFTLVFYILSGSVYIKCKILMVFIQFLKPLDHQINIFDSCYSSTVKNNLIISNVGVGIALSYISSRNMRHVHVQKHALGQARHFL